MSKVGIVQSQSGALVQDVRKGLSRDGRQRSRFSQWADCVSLARTSPPRPSWILALVWAVPTIPIVWAHYCGFDALNGIWVMSRHRLSPLTWCVLFLLIVAIPAHKQLPQDMLQSRSKLYGLPTQRRLPPGIGGLMLGGPREREPREIQHRRSVSFSANDSRPTSEMRDG